MYFLILQSMSDIAFQQRPDSVAFGTKNRYLQTMKCVSASLVAWIAQEVSVWLVDGAKKQRAARCRSGSSAVV